MGAFWIEDDTRCRYCEAPLGTRNFNQVFCSRGHQTAFYKHQCTKTEAWIGEEIPKLCEECGVDFSPNIVTRLCDWRRRRFCSKLCKRRAGKRRYVETKRLEGVAETGNYGWFKLVHVQLIEIEERPCSICSERDKLLLTVDHIIARCNGGKHSLVNLQVLCVKCHRIKTVRDLGIYVTTQKAKGQRLPVYS